MTKIIEKDPSLYYEDLELGVKFSTPGRTIFETDIVNFIALTGMYEDLFCNLEYIQKDSAFKQRIAPGALTFIITMGLLVRTGLFEKSGLALFGLNNVRWNVPVCPGDTVHAEGEVIGRRETGDGRRGILTMRFQVKNQRDEVVMEYEHTELIRKRPQGA